VGVSRLLAIMHCLPLRLLPRQSPVEGISERNRFSKHQIEEAFPGHGRDDCFQKGIARISHSPVLIADFDVFQYALAPLTATSPGSVTIYAISLRSL